MRRKLKLNTVDPLGTLSKGMAVAVDDGWRGNVEFIDGDCVVCLRAGERPNDFLTGYRTFPRWQMTVSGGKATVATGSDVNEVIGTAADPDSTFTQTSGSGSNDSGAAVALEVAVLALGRHVGQPRAIR